MATDVAELVVRLTMDNGGFNTAIRDAEKNVSTLQSDFRATAAEAGHFGKGMDGAKALASSLTQQITAQARVVEMHRQKLAVANKGIDTAQKSHSKLGMELENAKTRYTGLEQAVKNAQVAWQNEIKATSDNSDAANALGLEYIDLKAAMEAAGNEVKTLSSQYESQTRSVMTASNNAKNAEIQYNKARETQANLERQLAATTNQIKQQSSVWASAMRNAEQSGRAQMELGRKFTAGVTLPIIGGFTYASKAIIDFDSAFAGVEKTVDGTPEQMQAIRQGIIDISNAIPQTTTELSSIAESAGQLGIKVPNIISFMRTVADLKETTNLGDEGAKQMARFANIVGMSQDNFDRFGSAVVDLGNKFATTEGEIVSMALNLSGAGKQIGLTEAQILAVATALSSVGIEAEAGGSAFSRIMKEIQLAVETNSDGLKDFANVSGMTVEQFKTNFKIDAISAIQAFIVGLSKMKEQGISSIKTLDDMGLNEIRLSDTLLRVSNANELFSNALDVSNKAWSENTALAAEAEKRYATFESRLKVAGNQAKNTAMAFGQDLMPALESSLTFVTNLLGGFSSLNKETRGMAINFALAAAGIGPSLMVLGKANTTIAKVSKTLATAQKAAALAGGGISGVVSGFASLVGPAGIFALAAGGAALAGYGIYKMVQRIQDAQDPIKRFGDAFNNVKMNIPTREMNDFIRGAESELDKISMRQEVEIDITGTITTGHEQIIQILSDGKPENSTIKKEISGIVDSWITPAIDEAKMAISGDIDSFRTFIKDIKFVQESDLLHIIKTGVLDSQKINGAMKSFGIDPNIADSISVDISAAISEIKTELESVKSLSGSDISKIIEDVSLNGKSLSDALSEYSIDDITAAKIESGLADPVKSIRNSVDELRNIPALDESQQAKILGSITAKANDMIAQLNGFKAEYEAILKTIYAEGRKPSEEELKNMEALIKKIADVRAELMTLGNDTFAYGRALSGAVISGTGNQEMFGRALTFEQQTSVQRETDIRAEWESRIAELQRQMDQAILTGNAMVEQAAQSALDTAISGLDSDVATVGNEYTQTVNALFDGAAASIPGASEKLAQVLKNYDVLAAYEEFMGASDSDRAMWSDKWAKTLGIDSTSPVLTQLEGMKYDAINSISGIIDDPAIAGMWESFYGALSTGGLDNINSDSVSGALKAMLQLVDVSEEGANIGENVGLGVIDGLDSQAVAIDGSIGTIAQSIIDRAKSILQINSPSAVFYGFGGFIDQGLADGISQNSGLVTGAVSTLVQNTINTADNLSSDGVGIGSDFARGIANGINSGLSWIRNAARSAALAAKITARLELDEHSPSKVGVEIGKDFDLGIAGGIYSGIPDIISSMKAASSALGDAARQRIPNVIGYVDAAYNGIKGKFGADSIQSVDNRSNVTNIYSNTRLDRVQISDAIDIDRVAAMLEMRDRQMLAGVGAKI